MALGRRLIFCISMIAALAIGAASLLSAQNLGDAAGSIDGARILAHIKVLSSDEFDGAGAWDSWGGIEYWVYGEAVSRGRA